MNDFEASFSESAIVSYLCKLRVKVAKSRNKKHLIHLLTNSSKFNYHVTEAKKLTDTEEEPQNEFIIYQKQFLYELNKLLPSRKKWVILGDESRINKRTNQPLSASDRNYYSLIKTIKSFRKKSPNEPWLLELDKFIIDIKKSISSGKYKISPPIIYPKLKDEIKKKGPNKCRPISLFSLKDRVILSLTNKYLTVLFDVYFEDCSYAFRAKRNKENTAVLTHHDCIKDILEYKKTYQGQPLWVVECDMEKFFDSVNHSNIKSLVTKQLAQIEIDLPLLELSKPAHILNEYLDCYAFNKNVPVKADLKYWDSYKIPDGEFEWLEQRFNELGYYENLTDERIGVPQGGALSGLIANLVLSVADKDVLMTKVLYVRFCDDMLIIHPDQAVCQGAKVKYLNALEDLKLVPHGFNEDLITERKKVEKNLPNTTLEPFWKGKSKGPYKWDSIEKGGFPWIGFVGYDINYEGYIRVRKKSFRKELHKQKEVVDEIRKAVKVNMRKSPGSVTESAIHRLVGMSVGRVTIKNFDTVSNDLCWKNGFKELTLNKYSIQQIKQLDRNRNRLYYDLVKDLKEPKEEGSKKIESKPRQVIHFNKPFSYYYQVLERRK